MGRPGWLVAARSPVGEDESMWAARKLEEGGLEATAVPGEMFSRLTADATYIIYGWAAGREEAETKALTLRAKGVKAEALESGPIRPPAGEGAPRHLAGIRGTVLDDGSPAAYHVERRIEGADEDAEQFTAVMPDTSGRFFFWTNRRGTLLLDVNLPLELNQVKESDGGASVNIDDEGPAIQDVELAVESKDRPAAP